LVRLGYVTVHTVCAEYFVFKLDVIFLFPHVTDACPVAHTDKERNPYYILERAPF